MFPTRFFNLSAFARRFFPRPASETPAIEDAYVDDFVCVDSPSRWVMVGSPTRYAEVDTPDRWLVIPRRKHGCS